MSFSPFRSAVSYASQDGRRSQYPAEELDGAQGLVKEGWDIVEQVTSFIYAVGRIPRKGTCILIAKPEANRGILLTTSYVLKHRHDAADLSAFFFETATLGSGLAGVPTRPVVVALRPAKFFFSSAQPSDDVRVNDDDSLGYSVVACDILAADVSPPPPPPRRHLPNNNSGANTTHAPNDSVSMMASSIGTSTIAQIQAAKGKRDSISCILPLALPLIVSKIPKTEVGDRHLLVTHVNGEGRRKYYVCTVVEVNENYCVYEQVDPTAHFASGGPVFSKGGEFIGIQHQSGDFNFCIFIRDVVVHLFDSAMLGGCGIKIGDTDGERIGDEDAYHPSNSALHVLKDEQHRAATGGLLDPPNDESVGPAGDFVIPYHVYERRRVKVAQGPPQETLLLRKHLEIWKEWYDPSDYRSLVLLLHAFPHHSKLLGLVLKELTCHEQRHNIHRIAELGGIGVLVEALDNMAFNESVMVAGMTALGRISLYDENRDALTRCDGTTVVARLLGEYINSNDVAQWAIYCLLNMCHGNASASENIATVVRCDGLRTILKAVAIWEKSPYLQKWAAALLGHIVADNKAFFDMAIELRVCSMAVDRIQAFKSEDHVVTSLVFLVERLTHFDSYAAAAHFFYKCGMIATLAEILEMQTTKKGSEGPVICCTIAQAINNLLRLQDVAGGRTGTALIEAVESNLEELLVASTTEWLSEPPLHSAVAETLRTLGVQDVEGKYTHLQLGPSSALSGSTSGKEGTA